MVNKVIVDLKDIYLILKLIYYCVNLNHLDIIDIIYVYYKSIKTKCLSIPDLYKMTLFNSI